MIPVDLHTIQPVENAHNQLQTSETTAMKRQNTQRSNRSALHFRDGSYSTGLNNNCTTMNTSEGK